MFARIFRMDCQRCFRPVRTGLVILTVVVLMIYGEWEQIRPYIQGNDFLTSGALGVLSHSLSFDKFKVIMVILLAGLYNSSFCDDEESSFLRMILGRTDVTSYCQSRFLANTLIIVGTSVISFLLVTFCLLSVMPLLPDERNSAIYYQELAFHYPWLYIVVTGVQFGLVVAACCSISMLFSAFQADRFVSVGLPGLIFFIAVSYIPESSVFDVLPVISMDASFFKDFDSSRLINFSWSILYPLTIIFISGYLFYRRIQWRVRNGNI